MSKYSKHIVWIVAVIILTCVLGMGITHGRALTRIAERDKIIAAKEAQLSALNDRLVERQVVIDQVTAQRDSLATALVHYSTKWSTLSQRERNEVQQQALEFLKQIDQ